jgi:hypothetical protein
MKKQKNYSLPRAATGLRQRSYADGQSTWPSAKEGFFADGLTFGSSANGTAWAAVSPGLLYRRPFFTEGPVVGKEDLRRWLLFVDGLAVGKDFLYRRSFFADGLEWPSAKRFFADGLLCRPSAKKTVGNQLFSGCGYYIIIYMAIRRHCTFCL